MSAKRAATTELNHDNWNEEHVHEEAGVFTKASEDILERRVMKRAKRRLQNSEDGDVVKSVFGTFTGFKSTTTTTTTTSSTVSNSPFSFLANSNIPSKKETSVTKPSASNGTPKGNENGTNKKETVDVQTSSSTTIVKKTISEQEDRSIFKKSSDYFAMLKGLNESVAQWIKTHVDSNPFCILTPIFKDYERYLKEIETKHDKGAEKTAHTSEPTQPVLTSESKESSSTEKKIDSSPQGGAILKTSMVSEWQPQKSIFGNISTESKSIFGKSEHTADSNKSVFSSTEQTKDTQKSVFGNIEHKPGGKSIFGNVSSEKNPFLSKPPVLDNKSENQDTKTEPKSTSSTFGTTNTFCFGQSSTTSNTTGFSFGSSKPFTFGAQVVKPQESEEDGDNEAKDDDEDESKAEIKRVTEEGAIYEQRCKVYIKKDGNFTDRGVGILFLKSTPNDKTQLIVRAENSLGNLLLNTLLTESVPTKRMNKNTIMLVCIPKPDCSPPPVAVLLRVKTDEDADALFNALNSHKK